VTYHDQDIERADAELPGRDDIADDELLHDDIADDELLDNYDDIVVESTGAEPGEAAPAASSPGDPIARPAAAATAEVSANGLGGESAPFSAERLSQEWREIQATFVDDPRGAVQLAADAADSALTALMTSLRDHHATLGPSATQDTEQLREALQEYRRFCQGLAETGRRFAVG
jgi:hypothetical protein